MPPLRPLISKTKQTFYFLHPLQQWKIPKWGFGYKTNELEGVFRISRHLPCDKSHMPLIVLANAKAIDMLKYIKPSYFPWVERIHAKIRRKIDVHGLSFRLIFENYSEGGSIVIKAGYIKERGRFNIFRSGRKGKIMKLRRSLECLPVRFILYLIDTLIVRLMHLLMYKMQPNWRMNVKQTFTFEIQHVYFLKGRIFNHLH